ncbi:hypothetical protein ACFQV2_21445 [Actinokineospora soli]|uniref:Uncharacterized protein n=1 Tax=Actinokineospora soli TaxID=1048753 RepID=A0ABW2TT64_9PSEU
MRLNRSTSANRMVLPTTGTRSTIRSLVCLPHSVRSATRTARTSTPIPASSAHHHADRKSVTASSMRVGSGSSAPRLAKNTRNLGSTNPASTATVTTDIAATAPG